MVPYPAQGHVTPMLNLASALTHLGLSPVVVTPEFIHRTIANKSHVTCMSIPDGLDEEAPRDFFAVEFAMENNMPVHLDRLVRQLNRGAGVVFMIVDLLASWAFKVGHDCGVPVVGFWPVMFAAYQLVAAIPKMLSLGIISETGIPHNEGPIYLGNDQPPLSTQDLPWLIGSLASRRSRFRFWTRTLARTRTLSQILVNSFPDEHHIGNNLQDQSKRHPNITPIGPLMQHTKHENLRLSEEDTSCLDWLDQQRERSVVYISFGTWVSPISKAKVRNLAMALESSKHSFIWVLGSKWRDGLPKGYTERMSDRGRVVSWAPQSEVLRHKAVGCYLTHCGWNSTIEAIQSKVKLLCYPIAGDQFVNCDYIVKIWRIGIMLDDFGEEDVHRSLERVMNDKEMEQRLVKMNQRVYGMETILRVSSNLTKFVDDYSKLQPNSQEKKLLTSYQLHTFPASSLRKWRMNSQLQLQFTSQMADEFSFLTGSDDERAVEDVLSQAMDHSGLILRRSTFLRRSNFRSSLKWPVVPPPLGYLHGQLPSVAPPPDSPRAPKPLHFDFPPQNLLLIGSSVELSVCLETMQPFHTVTTVSDLMASSFILSRRSYGLLPEGV
ncbi:hypothetical protein SSX86_029195 [Deinandra increscens subsp. villosa]|uniref:UDP-glycosyltransferase n=1 Tax=Deinandra increscens subsp. villosa TaxID=3103831 RepID=A0AAP0CAU8_9ASTR